MTRHSLTRALTFGLSAAAIVLTSCSTPESRITDHPDMFQSLSPRDQDLVRNGQIRVGMSQNAVWLAWGSADQRTVGNMRGTPTETWVYMQYTTYGYGYGPYGYGWGGYGPFWGGFGGVGVIRAHGGHRFAFFGDPFYDPFYYSYIPPTIAYPYKIVTFEHGRVVSFQVMVGGYP